MRHPHGYALIVAPDAKPVEYDTATCAHCCAIIFTKPGTGSTVYLIPGAHPAHPWQEEMGAACRNCMGPVCLACHAHGRCTPFEKQLEQSEAKDRLRRQIAGLCTLILLVLGLATPTTAATITATSCNSGPVQAALDAAAAGDTVVIPNGTCQWDTTVTTAKAITIQGMGQGVTVLRAGPGLVQIFVWTTPSSGLPRLTGLTIDNGVNGPDGHGDLTTVLITGASQNLRIDHVTGEVNRKAPIFKIENVLGLIDHSTFNVHNFAIPIYIFYGGYGDSSWATPPTLGTASAFYIEDSTFTNTMGSQWIFAVDGWRGQRVVYRKNVFNNIFVGNHGTETPGRSRGARHWEIYDNIAHVNTLFFPSQFSSRGGTGFIFDNVIDAGSGGGLNQAIDLQTYRSNPSNFENFYNIWSHCDTRAITGITRSGTTATATVDTRGQGTPGFDSGGGDLTILSGSYAGDYVAFPINGNQIQFQVSSGLPASAGGTTYNTKYDGHQDATGYRCTDQIGAGAGVLYSGDGSGVGHLSPYVSNGQVLTPAYIYNNTLNGTVSAAVRAGGDSVAENRDYYNQNLSFNGSSGVGRGTLASRPSSCTTGVGYWATDQGEWDSTHAGADGRFYTCTGNAWALTYTPFTYPHPLIGGAPTGTAPVVTITAPTSTGHAEQTSLTLVSLAGTSAGSAPIASTTYTQNGGAVQATTGTPAAWGKSSIPLVTGVTTFVVTATDTATPALTGTASTQVFAKANPVTAADDFAVDWPFSLGPQWLGGDAVRLSGNAVNTLPTFDCAVWQGTNLPADQYAEVVFRAGVGGSGYVSAGVRGSGTTQATKGGYFFRTDGTTSFLGKFVNGMLTSIAPVTATFVNGDRIGVAATGNPATLQAFKNGAPVGSPVASGGEFASGAPMVCLTGAATADTFAANAATAPPPPVDTTPPTVPTGLAAGTPTQTSVPITWSAATDAVGVTGYGVYCVCSGAKLLEVPGPSALLTGLTCSTSYTIDVDAADAAGNRSAQSSPLTVSTVSCVPPPPPPVLASLAINPSTLQAGSSAILSISLDQAALTGGTVVTLSSNAPGVVGLASSVTVPAGSTATTTPVTSSAGALTTLVTITGIGGGVTKTATLQVTVAPPPPDTTPPSVPTNLASPSQTLTSVSLTWTASTDANGVTGYGVYRAATRVLDVTPTSATVTGLTCGTSYVWSVDAVDPAGNRSARSTTLTRSTLACPPPPVDLVSISLTPTGVTAGQSSTLTITLSGAAPSGGALVTLVASPGGIVTVPASATVPAGSASTTVTVPTSSAAPSITVTLTATYLATSRQAALVVTALPAPDITPPTVPTTLAAGTATMTSIPLSWSASTDPGSNASGVAGYRLSQNGAPIQTLTTTSAFVPSLTCGTTYTFTVDAVDVAGNRSASSAPLTTATLACLPPPVLPDLAAVSVLPTAVNAGSSATLTVTLTQPAQAGGLVVALLSSAAGVAALPSSVLVPAGALTASVPVATVPTAPSTVVTFTGLVGSTRQQAALTVLAQVATLPPPTGGVTATGQLTVTIPGVVDPVVVSVASGLPAVPLSLTSFTTTRTSITLGWTPGPGGTPVVGYGIYKDAVLTLGSTSPTVVLSGLTCGTTYQVAVDAVDGSGVRSARTAARAFATRACAAPGP